MNTIGGASGIKRSAEVKEAPVRSPPEEQPQAAKKKRQKDKDPRKWRGRREAARRIKKNVTFLNHLVGEVNQI